MTRVASLYVRGTESIRIVRVEDASAIIVYGPGSRQNRREFGTDAELEAFCAEHEQYLISEGWALQVYHERRSGQDRRKRPQSHDRRRTS
jgi:hypothetical protein